MFHIQINTQGGIHIEYLLLTLSYSEGLVSEPSKPFDRAIIAVNVIGSGVGGVRSPMAMKMVVAKEVRPS